jgi:hypothetical protein
MSDSPLFKARQAELAKRNAKSAPAEKVQEMIDKKEAELKVVQEEAKKAKKKAEQEAAPEPEREVFPPVLENKAIQPEEVKEDNKEDEEVL